MVERLWLGCMRQKWLVCLIERAKPLLFVPQDEARADPQVPLRSPQALPGIHAPERGCGTSACNRTLGSNGADFAGARRPKIRPLATPGRHSVVDHQTKRMRFGRLVHPQRTPLSVTKGIDADKIAGSSQTIGLPRADGLSFRVSPSRQQNLVSHTSANPDVTQHARSPCGSGLHAPMRALHPTVRSQLE